MKKIKSGTCIIGLLHGKYIYMGADSAGTDGDTIFTAKTPKIFVSPPYIIGFCGLFRDFQVIKNVISSMPARHPNMEPQDFLITEFITNLRQALLAAGTMEKRGEKENSESEFLIGYENSLYVIDEYFQLLDRIEPYAVIGCGTQVALGSLHSTKSIKEPKKRIKIALEAAGYYSLGVREPFIIERL